MKFRIVSLLFLAKQTRVVNSGAFAELELQRGAAGATPVPCVASSQLLQWNALFRFREEVDSNVVILQPWVVFF